MIASKLQNKYDLSSLKRITYGTEVMPQSTLDSLHLQFPNIVLQQTYGLSEVGVLHSKSQENNSLWVRLGGEGFQTKVVDGILWIKSQYSMVGYLNAPSEFDEDGWFNTQDKVEIDGEYLKILGRVTDIINVGGQKVYPAEVENIILNIKNIKDVVVFGEHHNLIGQIVVAKIQLKYPESLQSIKIKIRRECLSKLLPYKVPSKIIITKNNLLTVRQKKIRSS
jgi:acyl-CoA synthetase (AMP-forming)/AMP-acid ligase II